MLGGKDATRSWPRRLAGWLWLAVWSALLYLIHSPWRELGGLVSERLRWSESFVLPLGLAVGCFAGRLGRRAARPTTGHCHASLLRVLMLPPAALAAAGLLALRLADWTDPIGVVFAAFAAYWAGLDLAFGAYPLMMGEHYSFTRPIARQARYMEGEGKEQGPPPWLGV
jgi:hypothetical protein